MIYSLDALMDVTEHDSGWPLGSPLDSLQTAPSPSSSPLLTPSALSRHPVNGKQTEQKQKEKKEKQKALWLPGGRSRSDDHPGSSSSHTSSASASSTSISSPSVSHSYTAPFLVTETPMDPGRCREESARAGGTEKATVRLSSSSSSSSLSLTTYPASQHSSTDRQPGKALQLS